MSASIGRRYDSRKNIILHGDNERFASQLNLRHIRCFIAVADTGSIRGAARTLGITQPAVTKAVQQLETTLGAPLLMRSVSGTVLTSYGVAFLARARLVDGELGRAREELTQLTGQFAGSVAIGLEPTIAELIAPQVIAEFQARRPHVTVRIVGGLPTSTLQRVCDGSLDFVVGSRPVSGVPSVIDSWPLYSMSFAIALRKRHPLARAASLKEFAQAQWILTRSAASPDGPLARAFADLGLEPPRCRLLSDSLVATQSIVAATDCVSLMSLRSVTQGIMRQQLVTVEVPQLSIVSSEELFFRRDAPLPPAALELATALRESVQASKVL